MVRELLITYLARKGISELVPAAENLLYHIEPYVEGHRRLVFLGIGDFGDGAAQAYATFYNKPLGRAYHARLTRKRGQIRGLVEDLLRGRRAVVIGEGDGILVDKLKRRFSNLQEGWRIDGALYLGVSRVSPADIYEEPLVPGLPPEEVPKEVANTT